MAIAAAALIWCYETVKGIVGCVLVSKSGCAKLAKQCQWRRTNSAEPTCQQQRRLLLKQVGLEMTLMHLKT